MQQKMTQTSSASRGVVGEGCRGKEDVAKGVSVGKGGRDRRVERWVQKGDEEGEGNDEVGKGC